MSLSLPGKCSSLVRRLRRLLKNEQVQPATWYEPVARHLFAHWSGREVSLVMDRWHWHIGRKSDELFHTGDGHWRPLGEVVPPPGERHYLQGVTLTRQHAFGPVNVIAYWLADEAHPRYWSLDQPANKRAWRRGRKRFWIEPTFRDWKSYGFDLERSHIDDPRGGVCSTGEPRLHKSWEPGLANRHPLLLHGTWPWRGGRRCRLATGT